MLPPWAKVCEPGEADTEKSTTLSVPVAVCESVPATPLTLNDEFPVDAPDVVMVNVDVPEPITEFGLNVPVAPGGNALSPNDTVELKPFWGVTVIV